MSAAPSSAHHPLRGTLYFVLALLLFACLDACVKYLALRHPVPLIAWVRYVVHLFLMTVILAPMMKSTLWQTQRTGLSVVRALCLVVLSLCMMSGLPLLPLAEATSIFFASPMLVVLLARPLLGERIGTLRAIAVLAGFGGVMLIARPGGALDLTGVLLVLAAALCNSAYSILSRLLLRTERTTSLLFYVAVAGTIFFSLMLPWNLDGPPPDLLEWLLFGSLGLLGGVGHYFYTRAFRDAPASVLAPLSYVQLLWASMLGWLVFGQFPDGLALTGMLIIAASGVAVAWSQRQSAPNVEAPPNGA